MIFDTLRQICRTWLVEIRPIVEAAYLIHLPIVPHKVLPRRQPLETLSRVSVEFALPYLVTAVEDKASCVVLVDPQPGLRGLDERRLFFDCVPLDSNENAYADSEIFQMLSQQTGLSLARGVYAVAAGWISSPAQREGEWLASGELIWTVTGTVEKQHTSNADFQRLPPALSMLATEGAMRNAMTAIEELIFMANPTARPATST